MEYLKIILIVVLLLFIAGCTKQPSSNDGTITPTGSFECNITIDPNQDRTEISPYIYGVNQDIEEVKATARRIGGNRLTGYNWENNASNAGSDWRHSSDYYLP